MNAAKSLPFGRYSRFTILALAVSPALPVAAQDINLPATFGVADVASGFAEQSVTIQAGGDIQASDLGEECGGFIADAPDYVVNYSGDQGLFIQAFSEQDTTMVVQTPGGEILCNDDSDELNPAIRTASGETGTFYVWVGTFDPISNNTYPDADILVNEDFGVVSDNGSDSFDDSFNIDGEPTFGMFQLAPVDTDPIVVELQAGGPVDAASRNVNCQGFVADVPDVTLNFSGGDLDIDVRSDEDTTLVVVAPNGDAFCNDDSSDVDLNPGLTIFSGDPGEYAIFVGSFEEGAFPESTLTMSARR